MNEQAYALGTQACKESSLSLRLYQPDILYKKSAWSFFDKVKSEWFKVKCAIRVKLPQS